MAPRRAGASPNVAARRARRLFYSLCKVVEALRSERDFPKVFETASRTGARYAFADVHFSIGKKIGSGSYGAVFQGEFGHGASSIKIAIKVNKPQKVSIADDAAEVVVQTHLYCHVRDHLGAAAAKAAARVPQPFFAAHVPARGRAIGMEMLDGSLISVARRRDTRFLQASVGKVARLLQFLQRDLRFMHGDLHDENVMLRGDEVFLVDFGMSSLQMPRHRRLYTDDRYEGMGGNPYVDLLTLLSSLREDLAEDGNIGASRWCDSIVRPFWDVVKRGIRDGGRTPTRYGARGVVAAALDELRARKTIDYAHHLLYEDARDVRYPPTSPAGLLRILGAATTAPDPVAARPPGTPYAARIL